MAGIQVLQILHAFSSRIVTCITRRSDVHVSKVRVGNELSCARYIKPYEAFTNVLFFTWAGLDPISDDWERLKGMSHEIEMSFNLIRRWTSYSF